MKIRIPKDLGSNDEIDNILNFHSERELKAFLEKLVYNLMVKNKPSRRSGNYVQFVYIYLLRHKLCEKKFF